MQLLAEKRITSDSGLVGACRCCLKVQVIDCARQYRATADHSNPSRPYVHADPARVARADLLETAAPRLRGAKLDAVDIEAGLVPLRLGHVAVAEAGVVAQSVIVFFVVVVVILKSREFVALLALAGHGAVNGAADAAVCFGRRRRRGSAGQSANTLCGGAAPAARSPVTVARDGCAGGSGGRLAAAEAERAA